MINKEDMGSALREFAGSRGGGRGRCRKSCGKSNSSYEVYYERRSSGPMREDQQEV